MASGKAVVGSAPGKVVIGESVAVQRVARRADLRSRPPELPIVLEQLERRLKEKAHTRAELIAWLDGRHTWCEWEGSLSAHLFDTAGGARSALDALRGANASVDVELRAADGAELWVYRPAYSFRNKRGLEAAIRESRLGLVLSELVAQVEAGYKTIKQDIDALLREKRIFAIEDDRSGGKRGKVLFACIERGDVQPLYADKDTRGAYQQLAVPEHGKMLEILQGSEFRLPEDVYRRKHERMPSQASQPAPAGRKRPRMRNMTNPSLMGL